MLSISGLKAHPDEIIKYLLEQLQQHQSQDGSQYLTGYYAAGAPSSWGGQLAAEYGLDGSVDTEVFKRLLNGEMPDGTTFADSSKHRRLGDDLTFSAPKSVSIECLANGNEAVRQMHLAAIQDALAYIENEIIIARYGKNGQRTEKTGSALYAQFSHENSRPVGGFVQPNLHDHIIFFNVTKGSNGDLRARNFDFGPGKVRHYTADAIYKASLAQRLEAAGIETRQTSNGFELKHISDEQIANHSDRSQQIEQRLAESGKTRESSTAAERTSANFATRNEKASPPRHELLTQWRNAAREEHIPKAGDVQPDQLSIDFDNPDAIARAARNAVDTALENLGERQTVMPREWVLLEAIKNGIGSAGSDDIRDALNSHEGIFFVGDDEVVTQAAIDRERSIMSSAADGRGAHDPIHNADEVRARISEHEAKTGITYSQGQIDALQLALTSTDQTLGLVGAAGAGKTTSMSTIASEALAAGYAVVGLAPSKVAAESLYEAGISDVQTLSSWHLQERGNQQPRFIVLDESGMVSGQDMQKLLDGLRDSDRLLMVGDPKQLQPVEFGTPYAQLLQNGIIDYAEISEIRRQHDFRLLELTQAFASGDTETATGIAMEYATTVEPERNKQGKVSTQERRAAIAEQTAKTYLDLDQSSRNDTIVLCGTNDTRTRINKEIRDGLVNEGLVDNDNAQTINSLKKLDLTKTQLGQSRHYQSGHVIQLQEDKKTKQYMVDSVDTRSGTISMYDQSTGELRTESVSRIQERGQLYETAQLDLGSGDRVLFNKNEPDRGLRNGDTGQVSGIDANGVHITLDRTDNGKSINVTVDPERGAALDYSYARTIHKAQGVTQGNAIVAGEASKQDTAEMGYVACSREKYRLNVITDNTKRLKENWKKYADQRTATSAIETLLQSREGKAKDQALELEQFNDDYEMGNSADELNRFKTWDLVRHMEHDGFERDARESSRSYDVMRRGNEKLIVTERQGHHIFSDAHNDARSGTIIDYEKFINGRNIGQARQHLRDLDGSTAAIKTTDRTDSQRQTSSKDTRAVADRYIKYPEYQHKNSYLEQRGLDSETVKRFGIKQDNYGNAVIRHRDIKNNTIGFELKNSRFTGFSSGGERGLSMQKIGDGDIGQIVITESAIDSMSYHQCHRDEIDSDNTATVYISTGGSMTQRQSDDIREVVRRTKANEVRLAHDADASGDQMSARLRDLLVETQATVTRAKPNAKDWNEHIQIQKEQTPQAQKEQSNDASADSAQPHNAHEAVDSENAKNSNQEQKRREQQDGLDQGFESGL